MDSKTAQTVDRAAKLLEDEVIRFKQAASDILADFKKNIEKHYGTKAAQAQKRQREKSTRR